MPKLNEKIGNALDETRMLVLGIQIFIGFGYRTFFEPGFEHMSPATQKLELGALMLMLIAFGVLLIPVSYHRVVLRGSDSREFHRFATSAITVGLLPCALAMWLCFYLGARWVMGNLGANVFAAVLLAMTLLLWYGFELAIRRKRNRQGKAARSLVPTGEDMSDEEYGSLQTRLKQALTECRIVLPGAQALLGFQLIIMWMEAFYKLPQSWKIVHLASLTCVAVSTILLIMPAAYHRIVERGEDSEQLHRLTSRALLAAMVFLALGVSGDFYVAGRITELGFSASFGLSAGLLLFFLVAWFGYSLFKRQQRSHSVGEAAVRPAA